MYMCACDVCVRVVSCVEYIAMLAEMRLLILTVAVIVLVAMDREAKLRRLNDFRRAMPHCSASALSAIIAGIKDKGVPEGKTDRNAFREARNIQCNAMTPVGPLIQRITLIGKEPDLPVKQLSVAHPLALLHQACEHCAPFRNFMRVRYVT